MEIRYVDDGLTSAAWDRVVTTSPDGWPFGLMAWREVILGVDAWKLKELSFGVVEENNVLAVLPLQFDPRNGRLGASGWGGCGPIMARGAVGGRRAAIINATLNEVDAIARSVSARSFEFSIPPVTETSIEGREALSTYLRHGFADRSGMAQVIDLVQDEAELWAAVSTTARQTIRKARAAGITIAREDWAACVDAYYKVHEETYHRTGVSPHPRAYFEGIARHMAPLGNSVLWVARDREGEPIAFHNDMHFGRGAWYHTGCSTQFGLYSGANYLLFWEALVGAKSLGRGFYDCGEIFPNAQGGKSAGLTFFKTRFGGTARRFVQVAKKYDAVEHRAERRPSIKDVARKLVVAAKQLMVKLDAAGIGGA